MLTILISSAGRRVELINCFRSDARILGLGLRILAVDLAPELSSACQAADQSFRVPHCTSPEFIPQLTQICSDEDVSLVIPTIDTELQPLAQNRKNLEQCGTKVILSAPEVLHMARNKAATACFLQQNGIPVPRTASIKDLLDRPTDWEWPVIVKPINGSASIGLRKVNDLDEARSAARFGTDLIVQEFLDGDEYTVNLFFDNTGRLRAAVPHLRIETRAGEVSKGVTRRDPRLLAIAQQLATVLEGARGALCFQAIVGDTGRVTVFEINARFGGGYPLTHRAGAPFTKWLLEEAAGLPCSAADTWEEGWTMLRYDAAFFRKGKS